jgi:hypothetical protein
MKGLLIDPATPVLREIEFDALNWREVQRLVGGVFDYFVLRDSAGKPVALVYCADDARLIPHTATFSFPEATILDAGALHYNWPIVGPGVLVAFDGIQTSDYTAALDGVIGSVDVFTEPALARTSGAYRSIPADGVNYILDKLWDRQQTEMVKQVSSSHDPLGALMKMIGGAPADSMGRAWAKSQGLDPAQTYVKRFGHREPRGFIPRAVGTCSSYRCSVAELEAAFLGFHEWARKKNGFYSSALATAFEAPPFFFPDGLEPTEEEFDAGMDVERGALVLPFPMDAFWIVRWDMWVASDGGGEGPALLYVQATDAGFTTCDIFLDERGGYFVGDPKEHERLRRSPMGLITALHRLNNRRQIVERDYSTPELERANVGRAKSKHGLSPLPGFIRVTGRVRVGSQQPLQSGIERCPHDRRAHWRKRRNGVELSPEQWIAVRQSAIHPEAFRETAPKPYVVV